MPKRTAVIRYVEVLPALAAAPPVAAGSSGGFGAGWIAALALIGVACVAAVDRSRRAALAGILAGGIAFAFWRPLIHARLQAAIVLAEISFAAAAVLARRPRRGGFLRVLVLAAALLVANVIVLIVLAAAGAD